MDHRRKSRDKMTQDEYCTKAIAAQLDLEKRGANPGNQEDPLAAFLRDCLRERGLARDWAPRAKALSWRASAEKGHEGIAHFVSPQNISDLVEGAPNPRHGRIKTGI